MYIKQTYNTQQSYLPYHLHYTDLQYTTILSTLPPTLNRPTIHNNPIYPTTYIKQVVQYTTILSTLPPTLNRPTIHNNPIYPTTYIKHIQYTTILSTLPPTLNRPTIHNNPIYPTTYIKQTYNTQQSYLPYHLH